MKEGNCWSRHLRGPVMAHYTIEETTNSDSLKSRCRGKFVWHLVEYCDIKQLEVFGGMQSWSQYTAEVEKRAPLLNMIRI